MRRTAQCLATRAVARGNADGVSARWSRFSLTPSTSRAFSASSEEEDDGFTSSRERTRYKVVTPPVPSWRANDEVTALQWLRKHLRHAPVDEGSSGAATPRRGAHPGAAVFKLFRDRRVRVARGDFDGESIEDVRKLKRAGKGRVLEPGEFLCVPDGGTRWYWEGWGEGEVLGYGEESRDERLGEALRRCVIYEDEHLMVINKPPGLATVPGVGVETSVYDLRHELKLDGDAPQIVHRLDRDTSGVLVLARTSYAANKLSAMFRRKSKMDFTEIMRAEMQKSDDVHSETERDSMRKTYWALCARPPPQGTLEGWIDAPLVEVSDGSCDDVRETVRLVGGWRVYDASDGRVIVGAGEQQRANFKEEEQIGSKAATTRFKLLASSGDSGPSLLELVPVTGRKHQLRVHVSKALSSPVVGDYKYGYVDRGAGMDDWKHTLTEIESASAARADNTADIWRAMRRKSLRSGAKGSPLHLHSRSLGFNHPLTGRPLLFTADPPAHFTAALDAFKLRPNI